MNFAWPMFNTFKKWLEVKNVLSSDSVDFKIEINIWKIYENSTYINENKKTKSIT